ncbi:MAG: hypothetical protein IKW18_00760, partial [Clostridia bacterium]|nr:hypothetical protein [Clostridia bacterium]
MKRFMSLLTCISLVLVLVTFSTDVSAEDTNTTNVVCVRIDFSDSMSTFIDGQVGTYTYVFHFFIDGEYTP